MQEPRKVAVAWGVVVVVQQEGPLLVLKEKPLASKLELLYNKGLYLVALNLAHSEEVYRLSLAMFFAVEFKWENILEIDNMAKTWNLLPNMLQVPRCMCGLEAEASMALTKSGGSFKKKVRCPELRTVFAKAAILT